jgi:hypothetical protein
MGQTHTKGSLSFVRSENVDLVHPARTGRPTTTLGYSRTPDRSGADDRAARQGVGSEDVEGLNFLFHPPHLSFYYPKNW